jgi:Mlc titration factor MtfA (ptsG expression regulator)
MNITILILISLAVLVLVFIIFRRKKDLPIQRLCETYRRLLIENVDFYNEQDDAKKIEFENRMQLFFSRVRITGINTTVEDLDNVLIAASAIIPIFGFPGWEYINLHEVLVYPGAFDETFNQEGADRDILGLVGTGPYQNVMVLSKPGLREGFLNKTGKSNMAIHEFVHLIDKTDGSIDGIPEFLLSKQYILPWLELMRSEIKKIMTDHSDINPYGATSQAEFFAVVSEYFFARPDLLQSQHPELYNLLVTIFRQQPRK